MTNRPDPRLIEAIDHYAEDAAWDARAFAATEPGASLLADAEVGRAVRRLPVLSRIERGNRWRVFLFTDAEAFADGRWDVAVSRLTIQAAIAAALGDDE